MMWIWYFIIAIQYKYVEDFFPKCNWILKIKYQATEIFNKN